MSLNPPPIQAGTLGPLPDFWSVFVQEVLELTVKAYLDLDAAKVVRSDWEEDTFTLHLVKHLRKLAPSSPLSLTVGYQILVTTDEMLLGIQSPKSGVKIDIELWGNWEDYNRIYFAWEAKLIVDAYRIPEHERLQREYVTKGIFRFIDSEYSHDVAEAGMLGYVLYGNPSDIVVDINKVMLLPHTRPKAPKGTPPRALTLQENLQLAASIGPFNAVYESLHPRAIDNRIIQLDHLLLTFDFAP